MKELQGVAVVGFQENYSETFPRRKSSRIAAKDLQRGNLDFKKLANSGNANDDPVPHIP